MAEEVKIGDAVPAGSEVDPQKVLGDAMGIPSEESKGKTEEPKEGDQPKKVEEKTEKLEEKAEVKALDEIEVQTQKLFDQHKGDPKKLAEILANQYSLRSKHDQELGDLRKISLEHDSLVKRIHDDPEGVKKDIDALHKKEEDSESLLDRAYVDPKVLPKYIESKVDERLNEIEHGHQTEKELTKIYPDYEQTETQRKEVAKLIEANRFTYQELLHLVVRGFHAPESLEDAKKLAREEDRETLAKKLSEQPDKQKSLIAEEPKETPSDEAWDVMSKASR